MSEDYEILGPFAKMGGVTKKCNFVKEIKKLKLFFCESYFFCDPFSHWFFLEISLDFHSQ